MSTLSNNDIARAVYLTLKDKGSTDKNTSQKIIQFLFRRKLLSKSSLILAQLKKIIDREEGRLVVRVSTVTALAMDTKNNLKNALKKRYNVSDIEIQEVLNEKLIGGVKIEVGDEVGDFSIKNRSKKLQEYLITNHESR